MRFSEEFTPGAGSNAASTAGASRVGSASEGASRVGSAGDGASWSGPSDPDSSRTGFSQKEPSWTEPQDWTDVPFSGAFEGQIWEGTDEPAPSGPWGVVELSPMRALESLTDAVDTLERLNQLQCWADAQKARLVDRIRELYEREVQPANEVRGSAQAQADQDEFVLSLAAEEVGAQLRMPSGSAKNLVAQSRLLVNHHERTLTSMEAGRMSWRHATTIVEECVGVPVDSAVRFEQDLVEVAEQSTVAKLTRRARGLREILHPEAAPVRKARSAAERRVIVEPGTDGMAWLSAYLPAEQACGIYNRLDAGARGLQAPDEGRTLSQLRADVFTDLLTHTCSGDISTGTGFRGIGATVHITVPALTLLDQTPGGGGGRGADGGSLGFMADAEAGNAEKEGVADGGWNPLDGGNAHEHGTPGGYGLPDGDTNIGSGARRSQPGYAVLEGYGPIDAETAARLAGHAPSFTRILTHPKPGRRCPSAGPPIGHRNTSRTGSEPGTRPADIPAATG
ncbi:DUF222 domain-containing protein [Arthrobacter sp. EH-1B-1]|uniref:DUF222 domain-containing protein n=1 Tax=Arthrobacter vasquezii TaxID=2977629 RepID=A0ABT6CYT3_9MICC|nr:DUF222 domain-containing protein [Arthrobacter vasquezii]MDF9278637.1 DUF222 domain-containing protein [Arthrobacter vasquezii]